MPDNSADNLRPHSEVPLPQRPLPDRPNLRHLKDEAKALVREGHAEMLSAAQLEIARSYGFPSWPKLKAHVDSIAAELEVEELKHAIDSDDLESVQRLMTRNPALHHAPLGYGKSGPLTWVAECRVPWRIPTAARLAMAQWMIDHGSDVHQGGDGPLMRAALAAYRIPMMELLVNNGADVNAKWDRHFPILFAPCETVDPVAIKWLLDHGADPNGSENGQSALDYVIGAYSRSEQLPACIDVLTAAGGNSRYNVPAVMALLRGRLDLLSQCLDEDPPLVARRFSTLDFGVSGARRLTLRGATLLHVAAEYGNLEAARMLVERGADVDAMAELDSSGVGGQTPLFHAATQSSEWGLPVVKFLVEKGANLGLRALLPGHYERPEEFVKCTPLGYARLFPGNSNHIVEYLLSAGAPE